MFSCNLALGKPSDLLVGRARPRLDNKVIPLPCIYDLQLLRYLIGTWHVVQGAAAQGTSILLETAPTRTTSGVTTQLTPLRCCQHTTPLLIHVMWWCTDEAKGCLLSSSKEPPPGVSTSKSQSEAVLDPGSVEPITSSPFCC